jgi:hypothetical protein
MTDSLQTQCVQLSPQRLLIAMPDGRCWLAATGSTSLVPLPGSKLAAERATLAASLIEGAVAAGLAQGARAPEIAPYTLPRYIRWLVGNYVFAGTTPGLYRRGAERLDALGRPDLADFARQKADEESGHAELAYRDLESLGLPAAAVVRFLEPPSARAFADRFRACVDSDDPIALFGFSYCLERMAVERDRSFIGRVEAVCPPGIRAFRFLKVHSAIGSDSGHVYEQLAFFESLTAAELTTVVRTVYETAEMLARQSVMDQALSDRDIGRRLRAAGIELPRGPGPGAVEREAAA